MSKHKPTRGSTNARYSSEEPAHGQGLRQPGHVPRRLHRGLGRGPALPLGKRGVTIHHWVFQQRAFLARHGMGDRGETGEDNRVVEALLERTGASIMGKRMFEEGEPNWREQAPFHTPVFVLTHEARAPLALADGTTFYFANEGIERVLEKAREAARGKDVRIAGGASVVLQYLNAGLVEELILQLSPVFLGEGLRIFDGLDIDKIGVEPTGATHSPLTTHLRYAVQRR